jgi:hypothetical protein
MLDIRMDIINIDSAGDLVCSAPYVGQFVSTYALDKIAKHLTGKLMENIGLQCHTLEDLRKMGHPYARKPNSKQQNIPETPEWLVHRQSGDLMNSLHWQVTLSGNQTKMRVGHWVYEGKDTPIMSGFTSEEISTLQETELDAGPEWTLSSDKQSQSRGVSNATNVIYGTRKMIPRPYIENTMWKELPYITDLYGNEVKKMSQLSQFYSLTRRANTLAKYVGISLPVAGMYQLAQRWRTMQTLSSFNPINISRRLYLAPMLGGFLARAQGSVTSFAGDFPIAQRFLNIQIGKSAGFSKIISFGASTGVKRVPIPGGYDRWKDYLR